MLNVTDLVKSFPGERGRADGVRVVDRVSFEVAEGDFFTLLGPSGCGKTTSLRMIAGLEHPDSGEIAVGDRTLYSGSGGVNVPANQRRLGMVFQSYAIWPHMDVYRNVAFPLEVGRRRDRRSRAEIRSRVERVLEVTELAPMARRPATKLSGGQQQRLALARALVGGPDLVLLDEPLSNLDAKLRESMRLELKRLQRSMGLTSVYVTHDQAEALYLSNMIAVMNHGEIVQMGTPREIYERPNSRFVAEFIGTSNLVSGIVMDTVVAADGDGVRVRTSGGELWVSGSDAKPGAEVVVSLRPEDITVASEPDDPRPANEWTGTVVARAYLGEIVEHVVGVGEYELRVRSSPRVSIEPGTDVFVTVPPDRVRVLEDAT